MKTNAAALDIITTFEGFSSAPYQCPAGVWTIGHGSTRCPDRSRVTQDTPPLTREEALTWVRHELARTEYDVARLVRIPLTENQFGALVSFTYNVGSGNLNASTLRQTLNRGDVEGALLEFPKWRRAGGKILLGLVRRREAEKQLFVA